MKKKKQKKHYTIRTAPESNKINHINKGKIDPLNTVIGDLSLLTQL